MTTIKDQKYVTLNEVQQCLECKKPLGKSIRAKRIVFQKESDFTTKYLCLDCEKYYRTKDPSLDPVESF